jgi:type I restriction enzyme S subunit
MLKKGSDLTLEEKLMQAIIPEEMQPYVVSENWCWTKLKYCITTSKSKKTEFNDIDEKYVGLENIKANGGITDYNNTSDIKSAKNVFKKGKILYGRLRPYLNKHGIAETNGVCSTDILVFDTTNSATNDFINYFFDTNLFLEYVVANSKGINLPRISENEIGEMIIPLPPLAEQQRIVEQIEKLFDKLDKAKEAIEDAKELYENRRNAILDKAFEGILTAMWRKNNPNDSKVNLNEIISKRNDRPISKEENEYIDQINPELVMDEKGWIHLKLMLLCDNITCGGTPTGFIYEQGEIPFLKVYNIVNNQINFSYKPQFTDRNIHEGKLKSSKLQPNDVIMNIVGPPLRKIAIVSSEYTEWNMNQAIVRFRSNDCMEPRYLYYALLYPKTLDEVISETKGVVGQANISITQSRNLVIPVPSLKEQQIIVEILDDLIQREDRAFKLYDLLDEIEIIKKSVLAKAFRGELSTTDLSEPSSKELLKGILSAN